MDAKVIELVDEEMQRETTKKYQIDYIQIYVNSFPPGFAKWTQPRAWRAITIGRTGKTVARPDYENETVDEHQHYYTNPTAASIARCQRAQAAMMKRYNFPY